MKYRPLREKSTGGRGDPGRGGSGSGRSRLDRRAGGSDPDLEDLTGVVPGILRHDGDAQQGRRRIPRPRVPLAAPDDAGNELQMR